MGFFSRSFGKGSKPRSPSQASQAPAEPQLQPQKERRSQQAAGASDARSQAFTASEVATMPRPDLADDLSEPEVPPQPQPRDMYPVSDAGTPPGQRRTGSLMSSTNSGYQNSNGHARASFAGGRPLHTQPSSGGYRERTPSPLPRQENLYEVPYGHTRVYMGASFEQVLERVFASLQMQGLHVLSSVDLQQALQQAKVQCGDFRRYVMLTCCHPKLLFKGVFEEPSMGLLAPCTVLVMEGDFNKSDIVVQVLKPSTIYRALHTASPKLKGILSETDARFKIMLDGIASYEEGDSYD